MPPRRPTDCFAASKHGQYTAARSTRRSYAMRNLSRRFAAGTLIAFTVYVAAAFAQKQATIFVTVIAPASGPVSGLTAKDFVVQGGKATVKDAVVATEP